ncbi:helix-turn-helix transcriptional regulator [Ralstonia sp. NFACC01]|uniref:helix-turn-helix domain-containing protein n=1 Tax=Ralstonia sp. NFACC01 TaxID=1566294 RepID=UPI0008E42D42|nr:helix-turn-helix transcriptional regulator [Ralstonia sp. NFACC01]SFQ18994.1 Phage related protein [Ralstonia sp. NFACC01]
MKTTLDFLEAVSRKLGGASDYAVAKALRISRSAVSKYRNGQGSFDDETAMRIAEILGIDPAAVAAASHAERAKSPEVRQMWASIFDRLAVNFEDLLSLVGQRRGTALA